MADDVIRFSHVRFGEQETPQDKVIVFPDGVPGSVPVIPDSVSLLESTADTT